MTSENARRLRVLNSMAAQRARRRSQALKAAAIEGSGSKAETASERVKRAWKTRRANNARRAKAA